MCLDEATGPLTNGNVQKMILVLMRMMTTLFEWCFPGGRLNLYNILITEQKEENIFKGNDIRMLRCDKKGTVERPKLIAILTSSLTAVEVRDVLADNDENQVHDWFEWTVEDSDMKDTE